MRRRKRFSPGRSAFSSKRPAEKRHSPAAVRKSSTNKAARSPGNRTAAPDSLALHCKAKLECDGYVNYWLTLSGKDLKDAVDLKDIRMEIPLKREVAKYMMGLGRKGGYRPEKWDWKWDARYANGQFWIGDVNAGLAGKFKHLEDRCDVFNMLQSGAYEHWGNGGQGGARLREESDCVVLTAFTGPRKLEPGKELHFNFGLAAHAFPCDRPGPLELAIFSSVSLDAFADRRRSCRHRARRS